MSAQVRVSSRINSRYLTDFTLLIWQKSTDIVYGVVSGVWRKKNEEEVVVRVEAKGLK